MSARHLLPTVPATLLLLAAGTVLLGADCLGITDDDDDGEPVMFATDGGVIARYSGTSAEALPVWRSDISSANSVSLVDDGTTSYVGAGTVVSAFSLDAAGEQEPLWTWSAPDSVVAMAGPGSGLVFVMTTSTLHGLATDGGEVWSVDLLIDLGGVSDAALDFDNGDLILGGDPTRRLDPSSGAVTHTIDTGSSDVSAVRALGGVAYLATASGVLAVGSSALDEQWFHATSAEVDALAVTGSSVGYAVRGGVVGVLAAGGNPVFDSGSDTGVFDGLLLVQNLLVAARSDGSLLAWDEVDGTQVWAEDHAGPVGALDANGLTVFYGHGGDLEALNLSDGSTLWTLTTTGSPVAVNAL